MGTIHAPDQAAKLAARFRATRAFTEKLCEPLETEDYVVQSMPDVSPTRWHLAHMTWFFETFVLRPFAANYKPEHDEFEFLFNSYYNAVGKPFPRTKRGFLTRPTVRQVYAYRKAVDAGIAALLESDQATPEVFERVELGIHHEQQHQELVLMDLKHVLSENPLNPAYRAGAARAEATPAAATRAAAQKSPAPQGAPRFVPFDADTYEIGHEGDAFSYDNESPRHKTYLRAYALAHRLVTNGDYLAFLNDGGYENAVHWLSEGWATVEEHAWRAPLYWRLVDGAWHEYTLAGLVPLDLARPVCHVSYFEADAFARWSGRRLPTEAEWEVASRGVAIDGNFVEDEELQPRALPAGSAGTGSGLQQMFGDVWEWTQSSYAAYPGYKPAPGAIGEYNGKFMCNQYVLRGGSFGTSRTHIRSTYRNFFPAHSRWMFGGIRLADDA